ncbi:MAG TPA: Fe-S cluster assembly protein NifU [bacterium]|jgi:NifU-like protein|nr:Fe-S cluster assembly protein NifU [Myxococcales bacterium]OQA61855.1 MAG: NifU-like protein [bacterium ADurb.Bin270]HPW45656.1 Fe-S cluster assembly protein NifU [bacterium]HQG13489.1 Fe-S cluster assembly protein NifU [bacterium]
MWNYTEKVVDHFLHPRNVGEIENPDGIGEVGSLACGDMLRLTFRLGSDGKIVDAKFKTFGCASAIASSSALTEMIKGKTLEEALSITNKEIADYLGGLPEEKMHCSVMGREALEAAIENFNGEMHRVHKLEGEVVCKCFGVTEPEIRRVVKENELETVEQVTNYTKAGGACEQCKGKIQEVIDRAQADLMKDKGKRAKSEPNKIPVDGMTNLQRLHLIEKIIENRIRPALQQDHGDIELVDIDNDTILVKLRGACKNCPSSSNTLRSFVEKEIRKEVSPYMKVEEVKE